MPSKRQQRDLDRYQCQLSAEPSSVSDLERWWLQLEQPEEQYGLVLFHGKFTNGQYFGIRIRFHSTVSDIPSEWILRSGDIRSGGLPFEHVRQSLQQFQRERSNLLLPALLCRWFS